MKRFSAVAIVRFKKSVLEPQGKAMQLSLAEKNRHEFSLIRAGKYFEVELEAATLEEAQQKMERVAGEYLFNDVMETCDIEVKESERAR